jgi:large subunit ribosomal protein L25
MATTQSQAPKSIRNAAGSDAMIGLGAQSRSVSGKGEARRLRASGRVPAVAYGKGLAATLLSVSPKDVLSILKSERGRNSVIQMDVEAGTKLLVMIRDYSYHPVLRALEHVDFIQVNLDQPVDVEVPLIHHGKPIGVTTGGIVRQVYRTIPVRCVPDKIPLKLEIDITHLKLNEHVSTQDLKLPEGVSVRLPPEQTIVAVVAPEKEREETPVEGAAAVPGAAAAPGAPGAAGAADAAKDGKGGATAAAPAKEGKKK